MEQKIGITQTSPSSWKVNISLPSAKVSDQLLLQIFRTTKKRISEKYNITVELLRYQDLERKEISASHSSISVVIVKIDPNRHDPEIRVLKAKSQDGIEHDNMILEADIYPQKSDGSDIVFADLEKLIASVNIPPANINLEDLKAVVVKVMTESLPQKSLVIGSGSLPDPSYDGKLEYFVNIKPIQKDHYIGVERVNKQDLLCRHTPGKKGVKPGIDLRGSFVQPSSPKDYKLVAGENTLLSRDNYEIFSDYNGLLRIKQSLADNFPHLTWLSFSVEKLASIDGSEAINMTLDKPIEIRNGLKNGSMVVSQFEIIVKGDVESGANIQTASNIFVDGHVRGSSVSGTDSIEVDEVSNSRLIAEGKVVVKGSAENSYLSGSEVVVKEVSGCKIIAGKKIAIGSVVYKEGSNKTKLIAGAKSFEIEIEKEVSRFIHFAEANLNNLAKVFGNEIVSDIKVSNISLMIMKHIERMRKDGHKKISIEQRNAFHNLLSAIAPLKALLSNKRASLRSIEQKLKSFEGDPEIHLKNALGSKVEISIDGLTASFEKLHELTKLIASEGKIVAKTMSIDERETSFIDI